MKCKIAAVAGAIIGWGGACLLVFIDREGADVVMAQAGALSLGITSCAWLMLCAWRRPIAETYAYAYDLGRRDALRQMDGPDGGGRVVQLMRSVEIAGRTERRAVDA